MKDKGETKAQLLKELAAARRRVAELETAATLPILALTCPNNRHQLSKVPPLLSKERSIKGAGLLKNPHSPSSSFTLSVNAGSTLFQSPTTP